MSVLSKAKIRLSPMPCAVYPWSPTLADFPAVFFIFVTLIFVMKHKYKLSLTAAMSEQSIDGAAESKPGLCLRAGCVNILSKLECLIRDLFLHLKEPMSSK